jgi:hypothetical protein
MCSRCRLAPPGNAISITFACWRHHRAKFGREKPFGYARRSTRTNPYPPDRRRPTTQRSSARSDERLWPSALPRPGFSHRRSPSGWVALRPSRLNSTPRRSRLASSASLTACTRRPASAPDLRGAGAVGPAGRQVGPHPLRVALHAFLAARVHAAALAASGFPRHADMVTRISDRCTYAATGNWCLRRGGDETLPRAEARMPSPGALEGAGRCRPRL